MTRRLILGLTFLILALAVGAVKSEQRIHIRSGKQVHVVESGQNCYRIARLYGLSLTELKRLNPEKDLDVVATGDEIVVRARPVESPKPAARVEPKSDVRPADPSPPIQVPSPAPAAASPAVSDHQDKVVLANKLETEKRILKEDEPGPFKTAVSMILKLAVVLALAYFTILALKLISNNRVSSPRVRRDLKVVDTVKLSSTNCLHVVEVQGKTLLLGSSSGQVNLLGEIDVPDALEDSPETENKFAEYLSKYSGESNSDAPAQRVAGLLRDCASQLQEKQELVGKAGAGILRGCASILDRRQSASADGASVNNEA